MRRLDEPIGRRRPEESGVVSSHAGPRGSRGDQEESGPMMSQGESAVVRKSQEESGGIRSNQDKSGGVRRSQDDSGKLRRISGESGVKSQESGVRSQESGVRSQESGVRSQEESEEESEEEGGFLGIRPVRTVRRREKASGAVRRSQ